MKNPDVELFKVDGKGEIRVWRAKILNENEIHMRAGLLKGVKTPSAEIVQGCKGKTPAERAKERLQSRINKKVDLGYVYDIKSAEQRQGLNASGFIKPMTAKKWEDYAERVWKEYRAVLLQRKYDGHRCLITNGPDGLIAYSRNGKPITTIDHILNTIKLPEGYTLDGEIYVHGWTLQHISSAVKREQEDSAKLRFIAYDLAGTELTYRERYQKLLNLRNDTPVEARWEVAPTSTISDTTTLRATVLNFIDDDFEGGIVRLPDGFYESKRSKGLLKVKHFDDAEFLVVDIVQSDAGVTSLVCEITHAGGPDTGPISFTKFNVVAPGTQKEKMSVWDDRDLFIGRHVNVQYAGLTPDGIPFHPVAKYWREAEQE